MDIPPENQNSAQGSSPCQESLSSLFGNGLQATTSVTETPASEVEGDTDANAKSPIVKQEDTNTHIELTVPQQEDTIIRHEASNFEKHDNATSSLIPIVDDVLTSENGDAPQSTAFPDGDEATHQDESSPSPEQRKSQEDGVHSLNSLGLSSGEGGWNFNNVGQPINNASHPAHENNDIHMDLEQPTGAADKEAMVSDDIPEMSFDFTPRNSVPSQSHYVSDDEDGLFVTQPGSFNKTTDIINLTDETEDESKARLLRVAAMPEEIDLTGLDDHEVMVKEEQRNEIDRPPSESGSEYEDVGNNSASDDEGSVRRCRRKNKGKGKQPARETGRDDGTVNTAMDEDEHQDEEMRESETMDDMMDSLQILKIEKFRPERRQKKQALTPMEMAKLEALGNQIEDYLIGLSYMPWFRQPMAEMMWERKIQNVNQFGDGQQMSDLLVLLVITVIAIITATTSDEQLKQLQDLHRRATNGDIEAIQGDVEMMGKAQKLFKINFRRVVSDEGHAIKNYKTRKIYPYLRFIGATHQLSYEGFRGDFNLSNSTRPDSHISEDLGKLLDKVTLKRTTRTKFFGHALFEIPECHPMPEIHAKLSKEEFLIYRYRHIEQHYRKKLNRDLKKRRLQDKVIFNNYLIAVLRLIQAVSHPYLLESLMRTALDLADIRQLITRLSKISSNTRMRPFIKQIGRWYEELRRVKPDRGVAESNGATDGTLASHFDLLPQLQEVDKEKAEGETCGHFYCKDCVESHISLQQDRGVICITCMYPHCNATVYSRDSLDPGTDSSDTEAPSNPAGTARARQRTRGDPKKDKGARGRGGDVNGIQLVPNSPSKKGEFLEINDRQGSGSLAPSAKLSILRDLVLQWLELYPDNKIITRNLQVANRVIMMDVWWNIALEEQAFGRVYRMGQTKETWYARILVEKTIDMRLANLQAQKARMIERAIKEHDSSNTTLTPDELVELFRKPRRIENDEIVGGGE
ncbi:hypothetical protein B0T17DRAFT_506136 [Bombardia bombarda]|uniref:Uncharacterized protein n=1 Tax=Bombardia bombarda TaxID=252184 RepID=A0AA40C8Y8_9PEZI|nr:hypothetical protein B0T17DRAFT_506136 [Bombardia bombarda]